DIHEPRPTCPSQTARPAALEQAQPATTEPGPFTIAIPDTWPVAIPFTIASTPVQAPAAAQPVAASDPPSPQGRPAADARRPAAGCDFDPGISCELDEDTRMTGFVTKDSGERRSFGTGAV